MALDVTTQTGAATRTIEVDQLPGALDEILLDVRFDFHTVDVVKDGRLIARIVPPPLKIQTTPLDQVRKRKVTVTPEERERFKRLRAELRSRLHELAPEPFDAVDEIREQRGRW